MYNARCDIVHGAYIDRKANKLHKNKQLIKNSEIIVRNILIKLFNKVI